MADDFDMGGGAQNVSPWVTRRVNPNLLKAKMKYATLDKLLAESASLVPDSQKLSEELLKYKTSPGDKAKFSSRLNALMTDYLTKYQENPFYAFSREGKQSARAMQRIAQDPMLTSLEAMNTKAEKLYDEVVKSGNASKVNVKNGLINVYDSSTNKFDWISPDNIDYNKHEILTASNAISKKIERGFYNPQSPYQLEDSPEVTMAPYDTVLTNINRILEGIGAVSQETLTSNIEGLQSQLTSTDKTNLPNIEMKAKAIFSEAGLPPDYWDSLLSNVYSSYHNRNYKLPTKAEAMSEVFNSVNNIIYSRLRQSEDIGSAGKAGASANGSASSTKSLEGVGKYEMFARGVGMGTEIQTDIDDKGTKRLGFSNPLFWKYKEEGGKDAGILPLSMNPVFNSFATANDKLTTLDGRELDKALVLPVSSDGAKIVKGDSPNEAWLVFDAFVREDAGQDVEDAFDARNPTRSEEGYISGLESSLEELSKNDPAYIFSQSRTFIYGDSDYYRVPVRIKIDPSYASEASRTYLDKNEFKSSTAGYNLTPGIKKPDARPVYTPK